MQLTTLTPQEKEIKALKKQVRILQKKLEHSEADRERIETCNDQRESFLKGLISKLETSENSLKQRSQELENALQNLQTLQTKLVESEKMSALGVLAAGMAHEINNPLSFIYGNLSFATKYCQNIVELVQLYEKHYPQTVLEIEQKRQEIDLEFLRQDLFVLLDSMDNGAERVKDIISSLRTFASLGESPIKTIDIHMGLDSTLMMLNKRLAEEGRPITVVRNYGMLPEIECFSGQLNQAFLNCFSNAIDAIQASRDVTIQTNDVSSQQISITTQVVDDNFVQVVISDNGIGMSKEIQAQAFEPFFTTKPVGQGTGLGLAIAHQIITVQHQGSIHCTSKEGEGTTLSISLPMSIKTQLTQSVKVDQENYLINSD